MRDLDSTVRCVQYMRQQHGQALQNIAMMIESDCPNGYAPDLFDLIQSDDHYKPLRPYAAAFQAAEARVTYLLFGSPVTADALMAADQAAREASDEARSRVYEAALKAGLDEAERVALADKPRPGDRPQAGAGAKL